MEVLFICSKGCGVFTINEMKDADGEDPTLVCPSCGSCEWYITPKEREE